MKIQPNWFEWVTKKRIFLSKAAQESGRVSSLPNGQAQKSIIEGRSSSFWQGGLEENNWVYKPKQGQIE